MTDTHRWDSYNTPNALQWMDLTGESPLYPLATGHVRPESPLLLIQSL